MPDDVGSSFLTLLQSELWEPIKNAEPGFIQGLTKEKNLDLIKSRINSNMRAISIDGSAFDSTQHYELMECVDKEFWYGLRPFMIN